MNMISTPAKPSRAKTLLGVGLILLAAGAVVFGLVREAAKNQPAAGSTGTSAQVLTASAPEGATQSAESAMTRVYYFHGDTRCDTCLLIEKQASETVQEMFAHDIAAGRLQFRAINFDAREHRHFREDFRLSFGSVVVTQGSRYENLSEVWALVHEDRPQFDTYVVERVSQFMEVTP